MSREATSADELLARLADRGSAIVSSGSCSEMEIADARARGDFYVDANGYGYVLRLREWLDRVHARDDYMQAARVCSGDAPEQLSGTEAEAWAVGWNGAVEKHT